MERIVEYKFTKEDIELFYKRFFIGKIEGIKFFQRPFVNVVILSILMATLIFIVLNNAVTFEGHQFLYHSTFNQEFEILLNRLLAVFIKFTIIFTLSVVISGLFLLLILLKTKNVYMKFTSKYTMNVNHTMKINSAKIILENENDKITIMKEDIISISKDNEFCYILSGKYKLKAVPLKYINEDIQKYLMSYLLPIE